MYDKQEGFYGNFSNLFLRTGGIGKKREIKFHRKF